MKSLTEIEGDWNETKGKLKQNFVIKGLNNPFKKRPGQASYSGDFPIHKKYFNSRVHF